MFILHCNDASAGSTSDAEKRIAKQRFTKYYTNIFNGVKLKENEWWAARLRKDKFGAGFGGIAMKTEVLHREAIEHGGLQDIIIISVDEKESSIEIQAYALFKDNHKKNIGFPMEQEEGIWKISNKGYEVNRFAP